jgi:hypothetical protein
MRSRGNSNEVEMLVLVSVLVVPPSGGLLLFMYKPAPEPTEPDRTRQKRQYRNLPRKRERLLNPQSSKSASDPFPFSLRRPSFSSTRRRYRSQYSGLYPAAARHLFHQPLGSFPKAGYWAKSRNRLELLSCRKMVSNRFISTGPGLSVSDTKPDLCFFYAFSSFWGLPSCSAVSSDGRHTPAPSRDSLSLAPSLYHRPQVSL